MQHVYESAHKLAEAMYASSATQQGGPQGAGQPGPDAGPTPGAEDKASDENVVDAEFVDVDDKK